MSVITERERERRRFTAAVLGPGAAPRPTPLGNRVVRGVVVDAGPHMFCLATTQGEERFLFERGSTFWRGGEIQPQELRAGDDAVVLRAHNGAPVAAQVWAQAARATGVIVDNSDDTLEIDPGHGRPRQTVVLPYRTSGRISVRHPRLEPGYVFDAVGIWRDGAVWAARPATTQPPYPVHATPRRPPTRAYTGTLNGIVSWYDPAWGRATHVDPRSVAEGVAYPAVDRVGHQGCDSSTSCVPLPHLSIGATLGLRNDCTRAFAVLPVLDCAAADSRLCDLCSTCGAQGAGRVSSLTMTAFVALGGRLEDGCFNATVTVTHGEG